MALFDEEFAARLGGFDLDELDRHDSAIYGVRSDFTLAYLNEAWFRFASDNHGEPRISSDWGLGRSLLNAIPTPLQTFYCEAYRRCLLSQKRWDHDYECSSSRQFRKFHQTAYPLGSDNGLLIVNSLTVEKPHPAAPLSVGTIEYENEHGIIQQCCYCRRIKRCDTADCWDWVPKWVEHSHPRTSHGLCPVCYRYYYPTK
ncbi:MAG: hypothetical protein AB1413_10485 [Thermodesulfobacteriota bacterium]